MKAIRFLVQAIAWVAAALLWVGAIIILGFAGAYFVLEAQPRSQDGRPLFLTALLCVAAFLCVACAGWLARYRPGRDADDEDDARD